VVDKGQVGWMAFQFAMFAALIQIGTNLHNDYADFVKG
jgi:1,4-dihydroxy-2-naphthoate octaprenyltransferase